MIGPPKLDVYDVPVTDDNTCEISFISALDRRPTYEDSITGTSANDETFTVTNISRMKANRGGSVSLPCLAPGTVISQQFADENECLGPTPDLRNTQASLWVSRTSNHHRLWWVEGEGRSTIRIISEPPSSAVAAPASQSSDLSEEINYLSQWMTRSNLRPL
jgi:hypothetical protein